MKQKYRTLKRIRIAVSVIFVVMLTASIADAAFGATVVGRWLMECQLVPAVLAGTAVWIVLWVLVTLAVGRVYCSSVCPLGTLMDAASHCGMRLAKGGRRRYAYMPPLTKLRLAVPVAVAVCLFAGLDVVVRRTDPYTIYAKIVLAITHPATIILGSLVAASLILLLVAVISWRNGRIICNTICPAGGFLALLSRNPVYRVGIDTDKCIHCGKCEEVCKAMCIDLTGCVVDNSRCVMCLNCTAVCPNDAITVRRGRFRLSDPMMQPTMRFDNPTQASTQARNTITK